MAKYLRMSAVTFSVIVNKRRIAVLIFWTWPTNTFAPFVSSPSYLPGNWPHISSLTSERSRINVHSATNHSAWLLIWRPTCYVTLKKGSIHVHNVTNHPDTLGILRRICWYKLEYLKYLEYLELGQFRNFCDVFYLCQKFFSWNNVVINFND